MISTVVWLLNDMLSFKADINVPVPIVRNKPKNLEKIFFLLAHCRKVQDPRIRSPVYVSKDQHKCHNTAQNNDRANKSVKNFNTYILKL